MFHFSKLTRASLIIAISVLMVAVPLAATQPVYGACATGLNPTLHFTLLVPTSNPARRAWAAIVQNSLQCLGMDVSRVELPFSPNIYDRALSPPASNIGKTFDQGGFDILFVGYNLGIDPDPWSLYDSSQFAPSGSNYYLWNNTQNDKLGRAIDFNVTTPAVHDQLVGQWQQLAYQQLPSIPIFYDKGLTTFDTAYPDAQQVFQTYHYPAWPAVEHLGGTGSSKTTFIDAQTGQAPGQGVIPEMSTSYYDLAISGEIFSPLALRNDTSFKNMVPDLAAGTDSAPGWVSNAAGTVWNVTVRSGVTWQDGTPFTAKDVKFTFNLYQNDTFGSPTESFVKGVVGGPKNVTYSGNVVTFRLPKPYAYFVQNILGATAILPEHILNSTQFYGTGIDYSKIKNSLFNFPNTGTGGTYPVGTGPYMWCANPSSPVAAWSVKCTETNSGFTNGWNSGSSTAHLKKNPTYYDFPDWGTAALAAKQQYAVQDYFVQTIVGSDQAITGLNNGSVDFLDSQYHLETQTNFVNTWNSTTSGKGIGTYTDYGVQEMGVNMQHPILGTGTGTPYGQAHPAQAANASMWIRQAISYATPRTQIIQQLLNGYGVESITTPVVGNWRTGQALTAGFNTNLKPYDYNLTMAQQLLSNAGYTATYGQNVFSQYAPYIIAAVVIAAVAIAAIFLLRSRSHRHVATTTTTTTSTMPPSPPPSSGPPP